MKKKLVLVAVSAIVAMVVLEGCNSLSKYEEREYNCLVKQGIDLDNPAGSYDPPNIPALAAILNILPGFGNFYLSIGRGSSSEQAVIGVFNLLLWPISVVWGIPEAAIDAIELNKADMLYHYHYSPEGIQALQEREVSIDNTSLETQKVKLDDKKGKSKRWH